MQTMDRNRVLHIVRYCEDVAEFVRTLNNSFKAFCDSIMAPRAIGVDLTQIRETPVPADGCTAPSLEERSAECAAARAPVRRRGPAGDMECGHAGCSTPFVQLRTTTAIETAR